MSKRKEWIIHKVIPSTLFIGMVLTLFVYIQWEQNLLSEYPRYTIGVATETYWTVASGKKLRFEYSVNGKNYISSNRYNDECQVPRRYFVVFSAEKPSVAKILQDLPIPDSIEIAPSEGWKELPILYKK